MFSIIFKGMLSIAIISFASFLTGCVGINQSLLLDKGTIVEISDVSTTSFVSTALANDREGVNMLKKRIMELTKEELAKRSIEAVLLPTTGSAKLKYDIRTISSSYRVIGSGYGVIGKNKFEVKFRASLENPDGKVIFVDQDEKDDSDIDDVFEAVANRTAKNVAKSFKDQR
jgi:hypothetical protein